VAKALQTLKETAGKDQNLMPPVLEAVEVGATEGEIMGVFRDVYGEYTDPGLF
jgi:methylmalonyl-CoA mutase N-terminal domain/subunit